MFTPKTEKIEQIAKSSKTIINQLESIFGTSTRIYIDYANVRPWSNKLGWHIDLKRLKQFLDSFSTIEAINFYNGFLKGNQQSKKEIKEVETHVPSLRSVTWHFLNPNQASLDMSPGFADI